MRIMMAITSGTIGVRQARKITVFALVLICAVLISASATLAGWRTDMGVFKVGIIGTGQPARARQQIEPFRRALQDRLGLKVEVILAKNYAILMNALENGRLQYSVLSASAFAMIWFRCECVEPIAAARLDKGAEGFHAILLTDRQSNTTLQNLSGKTIVSSTRDSLSGYFLPKFQLSQLGLKLVEDPGQEAGARILFAGSTSQAREIFLSGGAQALLGWSTLTGNEAEGYTAGTLGDLVLQSGKKPGEFEILWKSARIANGPHVVQSKIPQQAKALIRTFLLELNDSDPQAYDAIEVQRGGGFAAVSLADYQPLVDVIAGKPSPAAQ